jgi:NADH:ubiquinone oxidoreductase subunit 3 (subunit A)
MMRGGRRETALTVAFLFCVLCGVAPLLIPTSVMADSIRFIQLAEGSVANFLYGLLVGYLFSRRPEDV